MKTKYITIPVLSVATALSLSSVAQATQATPWDTSYTWLDNLIDYNCNGQSACIKESGYGYNNKTKGYGANTSLVTGIPSSMSSTSYKFIGWDLTTYRFQKIDKKNCKIWAGTSKQPVTKMPDKIGKLNWQVVHQYSNDEIGCNWEEARMVPYSSNANDGVSGRFAASASWEPYYTFTLYLNGGVVTGNIFKNVGSAVRVKYTESDNFKLPTPTKQGYKFVGWCTDKELSWCPTPNLYDGNFNKTYYAKWEKVDIKPLPGLNLNKNLKPVNLKIKQPVTVE